MRQNAPLPVLGANPAVRIVQKFVSFAQVCEITIDYICNVAIGLSPAIIDTLLVNFQFVCDAGFQGAVTAQTELSDTLGISLTDATIPTRTLAHAPATVGTVAGNTLPIEMGVVLRKHTAFRGQHGMGRITMPAVPVGFTTPGTDPNLLNAAGVTAYTTVCTNFGTALLAGGQFWSSSLTTRPSPPAVVASHGAALSNMTVNPLLGTSRRRKEGRGI